MGKNPLASLFHLPRDLAVVAAALFTWGIGEGMFIYFQPLYLQRWGANPVQIGAILGMVGVAMAVAQAPAGLLSDRIGARPVMVAAWVIGLLATLVMALAGSLVVFVAGLMLYSFTSFVNVPMGSYIASMRGQWSVERAVTSVTAMFALGTVAGPMVGGLIGESLGLQNVYRVATGIFIISTAIIFLTRRAPVEEHSGARSSLFRLASNRRFVGLLAMLFLTMLAIYLPQPLTVIYLKNQHGFSVQTIGALGSAGSLGNALILLTLGGLAAPAGMLAGMVLMGLFALLMWQGTGLPSFFLGYFLIGGYRLCRMMALAAVRSLVKGGDTGLAFGLLETGNALSVIAAPLAAGFLYAQNPQYIYIASLAAIAVMLLVNFAFFPGRRRPAGIDAQPISSQTDEIRG